MSEAKLAKPNALNAVNESQHTELLLSIYVLPLPAGRTSQYMLTLL